MHYDESKIKKEYVKINGKKIPIYKIPTGMSGPNVGKINDNEYVELPDQNESFEIDQPKNKIYDEDNIYIDNTDKFIDY